MKLDELRKRWFGSSKLGDQDSASEPIVAAPTGPPMTPKTAAKVTAQLLNSIKSWIRSYVVITVEQAIILAVWVLHTYVLDACDITPYIHITAAEKESGKSHLMDALDAVSFNSIRSGGMTAAALVRAIDSRKPTLFLDEMDAAMKGNKEFAETQRGILNEGFQRGGRFFKCEGQNHALREFNVFGCKCFAGIGNLPDTIASRSIVIEMQRKLCTETIMPLRRRALKAAAAPLRSELETWASQSAIDLLKEIQPAAIDGLGDRQNDLSEPLLAIAQLAGDDWLQRLTSALLAVFGARSAADTSIGVTLLRDIRTVFDEVDEQRLPSQTIVRELCDMEGSPWAEWFRGKGLSANNLAWLLKKYGIYPHPTRFGKHTAKGYLRGEFEDAWARYCPVTPNQTDTTSQPASLLTGVPLSNRNSRPAVTDGKKAPNTHEHRGVTL